MAPKNKSNQIKLTRIYDAPVKMVWDAWTDPEKVAKWWGPRGFTITTHSKDLKPGGFWRYTMHGPDGVDYPNKTEYFEVEKYSRLIYDHGGSDDSPPLFRVTVLFSESKGKTKLEMTMTTKTPEEADATRKFIKKAGGYSTWDRLGEYLAEEKGKVQFILNRSFDAPVATLFDMWTNPEHLAHWMPPTGFSMRFIKCNIEPGGSSHYQMSSADGKAMMWGRADYLEMERPNRIVYTQQFCDQNEKVTRHPMSPTWPETMMTVITLMPEENNQTRVTITWEPYKAKADEIETFKKARSGMTQGWTGSLDKLENYLGGEKAPDLVITREFDAPRDMVWKAWTDQKQVQSWWGPMGFTNPVCELDVRVGGKIRIHMKAPDGVVYPMAGEFEKIHKPDELVYMSEALDDKGNALFRIRNAVTFSERGGKTTLTLSATVVEVLSYTAPQYLKGMEQGWNMSLDRLREHLKR